MKLITILILITSMFFLISCGEDETTPTPTPFVSLDDIQYQNLSCSFSQKGDNGILSLYVPVPSDSDSDHHYIEF